MEGVPIMHYIVLDLEFNQDLSSFQDTLRFKTKSPFEIIQIGAIKLDEKFQIIGTFNRYVKPTIYAEVSPFIEELTGISTQQLEGEETFPKVFQAFYQFISQADCVFCIWGMSDMKELFRNAQYHHLNIKLLPTGYINLQPYVSVYFGLPSNQLLSLRNTVEALNIPLNYDFHNAYHDAFYTAEIFKKVHNTALHPQTYDPHFVVIKPRLKKPKKIIDYDKLIKQFEKMYERQMTPEEILMIKLAYHMGKTKQFLK